MLYKISDETIPQSERKNINEKILFMIEQNQCEQYGISKNDIFNSYTGQGGLHGLEFKSFNNYHEYSTAKKNIDNGQHFTPANICNFMLDCLNPSKHDLICDLTFGMGNFFNYVDEQCNCYGTELDIKAYKVAKYLYPEANLKNDDIRYYKPNINFDIVIGNPPFNLRWNANNEEYLSQLYYCIKAYKVLKPAGLLMLIVPNSFLNDEFIDAGMIKQINEKFNFVFQCDLPSNAFKSVGVDNFNTKIMLFSKKSEYITESAYSNTKIDISNISEDESNRIYNTYIKPLVEQKDKVKSKILLESIQNSDDKEDKEFKFKVNKLLFDIKRNGKVSKYYAKCFEYYNRYLNQKMPEGMKFDEWCKIRLTPNKVLAYLKRYLNKQNEVEKDIIKLVKSENTLKLKAYSRKTQIQLSKITYNKEANINDMILNNYYPFEDKSYYKLFKKKQMEYEKQSQNFNDMQSDFNIQEFLNNIEFNDTLNEKIIKPNKIQKTDINKVLQKKYNYLQWSMGTGKSLSATIQGLYRLKYNNIKNPIVIAPSIAITGTWIEWLDSTHIDYIVINSINSLKQVKQGQFILITLYMVNKYKRHIKKFIKQNNYNFCLLFDEADAITSLTSKTYKSVLSCFRKIKYKSCLSGTMTRNNLNEAFPAFELLYNNSINMLNKAEYIYYQDKETNEIESEYNKLYNKPFSTYKKGLGEWKSTFSPTRASVFGIQKNTQNVYNSNLLKELLNYTVITRTFKDITGREGYTPHQIPCYFNQDEKNLYKIIVERFYEIEREYFHSTGNSRKDSMLRLLNQINLLLKACEAPHTFNEWRGDYVSTKFKKVAELVNKFDNEQVAIGCISKKAVKEYETYLMYKFPNRKVIAFTGEDNNITQRKKIVKEMQKERGSILVTTQQCLSCSLNIGYIDKIIIPSLQYNNSRLSQYFFRFIRYNSTKDKDVYFVLFQNSIEMNLLKLIMVKEKANLLVKGEELSEEEIENNFGVDFELMNQLLGREQDEEGHYYISWGEQEIV